MVTPLTAQDSRSRCSVVVTKYPYVPSVGLIKTVKKIQFGNISSVTWNLT